MIYLDPVELIKLTSYTQPACQRAWLDERRVPYIKHRRGKLRTVVRQVDADRLFEDGGEDEPDWSAMGSR